jgi:hypothetical protein
MATITPEQRQELEKSGNQPVKIEDPENHRQYVIISAELYERMRALVDIEHVDRSLYEYGDFRPLKP